MSMTAFAISDLNQQNIEPVAQAATAVDVRFNAYSGIFSYERYDGNNNWIQETQEFYGGRLESGKVFGEQTSFYFRNMSDPVRENAQFEGWMVGTWVQNPDGFSEFKQFEGTGVLTTAQALAYPVQADRITMFMEKWTGDDADYYSQVYISGYDAQFTVEMAEWHNGTQTWNEQSTSSGKDKAESTTTTTTTTESKPVEVHYASTPKTGTCHH